MKIVSINAAQKRVIEAGGKSLETGIYKQAVAGPVAIGREGIAADTIVDRRVHGGEDQALYLYSQADYLWWEEQLSCTLSPGTFGENITLSHFPETPLRIGDRITMESGIVLEVTAPRVPCVKLATRMNDAAFGKKFVAAEKPGAYVRVIQPGELKVGDLCHWEHATEEYATLREVFVEWHKKDWSRAVFEKALRSPISSIARGVLAERMA